MICLHRGRRSRWVPAACGAQRGSSPLNPPHARLVRVRRLNYPAGASIFRWRMPNRPRHGPPNEQFGAFAWRRPSFPARQHRLTRARGPLDQKQRALAGARSTRRAASPARVRAQQGAPASERHHSTLPRTSRAMARQNLGGNPRGSSLVGVMGRLRR